MFAYSSGYCIYYDDGVRIFYYTMVDGKNTWKAFYENRDWFNRHRKSVREIGNAAKFLYITDELNLIQ